MRPPSASRILQEDEPAPGHMVGPNLHLICVPHTLLILVDTTWFGLLAVVALVLANGFFVATEFAIVAVRKSRLEQLAAEGNRRALAAREVITHLDAYIAACQLGITMASLALG